jgi:ELWxxDGT repeat protein
LSPLTWGTEVSPSAATTDLYQVKTTSYGPGKLAATWLRRSATTSFYHLDLVTSNDNGATWSTPIQISTHNDNNYQPIFMPNGLGQLAVLWRIQYSSSVSLKTAVLGSTLPADPRAIYQVAEINPGAGHANTTDIAILNNKMYLIAQHVDTGFELFEFDGSQVRLVEDLYPGVGWGVNNNRFLAKTADALYFQGTNGITGFELYKFDGTSISLVYEFDPAQTTLDQTQNQLAPGSLPGADGAAVILGNRLFLNTDFPSSSTGYVVDLSANPVTATKLTDYFTGYAVNSFFNPVVIGSNLYYRAGDTIYKTDGVTTPSVVPGTAGLRHFNLGQFDGKLLISASPVGNTPDVELLV